MAKQYQISYFIKAFDQATATLDKIEKKLDKLDKSYEKVTDKKNNQARTNLILAKTEEQLIKNSRAKTNALHAEKRAIETHSNKVENALKKQNSATDVQIKKTKTLADLEIEKKKNLNDSIILTKKTLDAKKIAFDHDQKVEKLKTESIKTEIAKNRLATTEILNNSRIQKSRDSLAKQAGRDQRRQQLQRYTDLSHAQESARSTMLYMATPATANALFALRNTMNMEQLGIRMRGRRKQNHARNG